MPKKCENESELPSQRGARVGELLVRQQRIRLGLPAQHALVEAMQMLRIAGLNRLPGEPTMGLRVIQPSGSGKSHCAKLIKDFVEASSDVDPSSTPVLHVTLETQGTPKSAVSSCLAALGDHYATRGTEQDLLLRFQKALATEGVQLLIVDELNHCAEKVLGRDVSNTLKNMLTKGWVPIVFLGTSEADKLFQRNRELRNRCHTHRSIAPLDPDKPADLAMWSAFLGGLDDEIVKQELLKRHSNLGAPDLAKALCIACGGVIGEVRLVIDEAFCAAVGRSAHRIELTDLHQAVENLYVIEDGLTGNPLDDLLA